MQRKFIQLTSVKLAYYDEGHGEPIMLLHGFPDSADVWRHLIPLFVKNGYRVIAPDLRGFGESELLNGVKNYQIKMIMQDLLELKNRLSITDPIKLIAHDWGANIGWMLVSFFPQEFSTYVALSVGHPYAYALDGGFEQRMKGWYTMAFQFEGMAEQMFSQNDWAAFRVFTQENPELDVNWLRDLRRPGRFTAALNLYRANLKPVANAPKIQPTPVPVLGIYGSNDLYLSESQMVASKKYISGGFTFKTTDAGHWLPLEAPQQVFSLVTSFYQAQN